MSKKLGFLDDLCWLCGIGVLCTVLMVSGGTSASKSIGTAPAAAEPSGQVVGEPILTRPTGESCDGQADYYARAWKTLKIQPSWSAKVDAAAKTAIANKKRYQAIVAGTAVPWEFVAATHMRESGFDFTKNLHNGEPLSVKTTLVPQGRGPFFDWESSAKDALFTLKKLDRETDWGISAIACKLEAYNGMGYAGKGIPSPYLFSGSQHYTSGKYVRDRVFDPSARDQQVGALVLIARIRQIEGAQ